MSASSMQDNGISPARVDGYQESHCESARDLFASIDSPYIS